MVGNIICPVQFEEAPFDPSSIFDPVTNTATEADFIRLLEAGIYDSSFIGKFVTLSNTSGYYDGGKYIIADVDHDSTNTGQTNCYDLISVDCINFGSPFGTSQYWRNSGARTWLKDTFYEGLSANFKARMLNIKYNSNGSWYADDKVILPSFLEVNGNTPSNWNGYYDYEGKRYPIFDGNTSRRKYMSGSSSTWWTRSRYTQTSTYVWYVMSDGSINASNYGSSSYMLAPLMRVQ